MGWDVDFFDRAGRVGEQGRGFCELGTARRRIRVW